MPLFYWDANDLRSDSDGWHVVVSSPDVDAARTIAFDKFRDTYAVEPLFHLDYAPTEVVEGDGAIVVMYSSD